MKPTIRRAVCALLVLALLMVLPSCLIVINRPSTTTAPSTTDTPPAVTTGWDDPDLLTPDERAKRDLGSLIDYEMSGKTIILATCDVTVPKPNANYHLLDNARWKIITEVEEKYRVELLITRESAKMMQKSLNDAKASGLYYADIILVDGSAVGNYYADGLLADLSSLPFLSPEARYYYQQGNASAAIGKKQYALAGTAGVNQEQLGCLYFNAKMWDGLSEEDLRATAFDGKWTWDALLAACRLAAYDADGNTSGLAGLLSAAKTPGTVQSFAEAAGLTYIDNGDGALTLYSPVGKPQTVVGTLKTLLASPLSGYTLTDEDRAKYYDAELGESYDPSANELFFDGKSLFYLGDVGDAQRFSLMKSTALPLVMPKLDAEQSEYSTPTAGRALLFAVPESSQSMTEAALILEALNVRAGDYITEAFLDNFLYYYARDDRSVDMLALILKHPHFDFAAHFAAAYPALAKNTVDTMVKACEGEEDLLDLHYRSYFDALDSLESIRQMAG